MKALIRNTGETVLETAGIDGIDWTTGAPLTNPSWAGGAYAICADCPADADPSDFDISAQDMPTGETDDEGNPVTISRKIATLNQERYNARKAQEASE